MQGKQTSEAQSTTALMSLVPVLEGQLAPTTQICKYNPDLCICMLAVTVSLHPLAVFGINAFC